MSASLYLLNCRLPEELDVNMSNSNARTVLSALGFDANFEEAPDIQIREFWAACQNYLNSEIADIVDGGKGPTRYGNLIDCGLRSGYITEKVKAINSALEWGMEHNAKYVYFT